MVIKNAIVVLLTLILIYLNMRSIVKCVRIKDKFMHINLLSNDYVITTVRPYKQKLLMYNRILFLVSLVVAPFIIIFSKSSYILLVYVVLFLILPVILNQFFITKYVKEIKDLRIATELQDNDIQYFSLLYSKDDDSLIYSYSSRYAFNIASIKGKALVTGLIALIIALLVSIVIFIKPAPITHDIQGKVANNELVIKYEKETASIPIKDIKSIRLLDSMPQTLNKISGIQEAQYYLGEFENQSAKKVNYIASMDAVNFLEIKTKDKIYIYSSEDETNFSNVYTQLKKTIEMNDKAKAKNSKTKINKKDK
ncbi:MAG: PH domain-containing protein [Erysipelotrichales bacterium]